MTDSILRRSPRVSSTIIPAPRSAAALKHSPQVQTITWKKRKATDAGTLIKGKKARPEAFPARHLAVKPSKTNKSSYSTGDVDDVTPPPSFSLHPAGLYTGNAPNISLDGATEVAVTTEALITTNPILTQAEQHLVSIDQRFKIMIAQWSCPLFTPAGLAEPIDPFRSLVSGICGQQLSGASAKACKKKFVALFNGDTTEDSEHVWPTPTQVISTSVERLRLAGLSLRKAEYIRGLAQKFVDGELTTELLLTAPDEVVMEKLVSVRGLGPWSVEMFMCFGLKRLDVFSTGDLGVQKGMAVWGGKDVSKLKAKGGGKWKYMSETDMLDQSAPYRPYRSLFMWYMWRAADTDTRVLTIES